MSAAGRIGMTVLAGLVKLATIGFLGGSLALSFNLWTAGIVGIIVLVSLGLWLGAIAQCRGGGGKEQEYGKEDPSQGKTCMYAVWPFWGDKPDFLWTVVLFFLCMWNIVVMTNLIHTRSPYIVLKTETQARRSQAFVPLPNRQNSRFKDERKRMLEGIKSLGDSTVPNHCQHPRDPIAWCRLSPT